MSDLRARLVEALREAIANEFWADLPDQVLPGANFGPAFDGMTKAAVDVLLSLPGIAIVDPELVTKGLHACYDRGTPIGPQMACDLFDEFEHANAVGGKP